MASRTFTAEECHRINSDASHNIRPRGIAAPNAFGPPRTFNIEHPISKNEVARESREYTRKKFQEKKIIRGIRGQICFPPCVSGFLSTNRHHRCRLQLYPCYPRNPWFSYLISYMPA